MQSSTDGVENPKFNGGVATAIRIDKILQADNEACVQRNDAYRPEVIRTLNIELSPFLSKDEAAACLAWEAELSRAIVDMGRQRKRTEEYAAALGRFRAVCTAYDMYLRRCAFVHKLLMPENDDPRLAIARGTY